MKKSFLMLVMLSIVLLTGCGEKENQNLNNEQNNNEQIPCTFNGELVQGAEYVQGQYTYRYMQEANYLKQYSWNDIEEDGWGVVLTDKNSTSDVTSELCSSINGKPIVSMNGMFGYSETTKIDFSSFDTSSVTNMTNMFFFSKTTDLDLSNFNTSNVTDMSWMFYKCDADNINVSSFNTSKVTDMSSMFLGTQPSELDLSSFDLNKVDITDMFYQSNAETIYVKSSEDIDFYKNNILSAKSRNFVVKNNSELKINDNE